MRAVYNALRSRRLAFWLIASVSAYSAVAAGATKGDFGRAFATAPFYLLTGVLALATAACAWERSVGAIRHWRHGSAATPAFVRRLIEAPQLRVPVSPDDASEVIGRAAEGLQRLRLRANTGERRIFAATPRVALIASPTFHWALVALFLVLVAGRLTRSEGLIGIPVGSERLDAAGSYGFVDEAPLHRRGFSGLTIRVPELTLDYEAGGVERGAAPQVELYDGTALVASGLVYPNSPLRYGSLMVHADDYGLAAHISLRNGDAELQSADTFYDFADGSPLAGGAPPLVVDRDGETVIVDTYMPLEMTADGPARRLPATPALKWTMAEGETTTTTGTLRLGESLDLGAGASLVFEDATYYARVSVVDDWSVYPLYAVLALAVASLAFALLLPPKAVWVMLVESDEGLALHARTRQSRADRLFANSIEDVLEDAARRRDDS